MGVCKEPEVETSLGVQDNNLGKKLSLPFGTMRQFHT